MASRGVEVRLQRFGQKPRQCQESEWAQTRFGTKDTRTNFDYSLPDLLTFRHLRRGLRGE